MTSYFKIGIIDVSLLYFFGECHKCLVVLQNSFVVFLDKNYKFQQNIKNFSQLYNLYKIQPAFCFNRQKTIIAQVLKAITFRKGGTKVKKSMFKRTIALASAVVMGFTCLGTSAFATDVEKNTSQSTENSETGTDSIRQTSYIK